MLKNLIFLTLPLILSAIKFCADEKCVIKKGNRIAGPGGIVSRRHSRPFQVALYSRVGTTGAVGFCGGSLIHPQWVLTAAHCCYHDSQEVDNVQAILGAHSLYDRYESGRRIVNVDTIVVHPEYDPETVANDLALLRLANVMQLTSMSRLCGASAARTSIEFVVCSNCITVHTINVIRLPYLSQVTANFAGQRGEASGWGIAAEGVTFVSPTLREFYMTVLTDAQCGNTYLDQLPANVICGYNEDSGTCKGDNGGPLTLFWNDTEEILFW
ncbi:hypothetical protein ACJJTC_006341 [Scirpophaga incertulas]